MNTPLPSNSKPLNGQPSLSSTARATLQTHLRTPGPADAFLDLAIAPTPTATPASPNSPTPPPAHAPTATAKPERTRAQQEASRANGARSHGPATALGKTRSRRNAVKTGMTGAGVALPAEIEREVVAETEVYRRQYRPETGVEERLVDIAALASVRWMWLSRADARRTASNVRFALERWDAARDALVARWARHLNPWDGEQNPTADPASAVSNLARMSEGCDYLADAWDALRARLESGRPWNILELRRAGRLTGRPDGGGHPGDPDELRAFWADYHAATTGGGDPAAWRRALDALAAFRDAWIARGDELWASIDAPDRSEAPDRALFDTSAEGARLARYLNDADRMRRRALSELARLRKERAEGKSGPRAVASPVPLEASEAPAQNEPGAADGETLQKFASNSACSTARFVELVAEESAAPGPQPAASSAKPAPGGPVPGR
jgi:hypothetical protein